MMALNLRHWNGPPAKCRGRLSTGGIAAAVTGLALAGCNAASSPTVSSATPETSSAGSSYRPGAAKNKRVRLATVTTIQSGGLLDKLVADFEEKTGETVEVYAGDDPYTQARAGKADLVFSHPGPGSANTSRCTTPRPAQDPFSPRNDRRGYLVKSPARGLSGAAPSKSPPQVHQLQHPEMGGETMASRLLTVATLAERGSPRSPSARQR